MQKCAYLSKYSRLPLNTSKNIFYLLPEFQFYIQYSLGIYKHQISTANYSLMYMPEFLVNNTFLDSETWALVC